MTDEIPKFFAEDNGSQGPSFTELLAPLIKNLVPILFIVGFGVAISAVYNSFASKVYQAQSSVVIRQRPASVAVKEREAEVTGRYTTLREMNTIISLVNSQPLRAELTKQLIDRGYFSNTLEQAGYYGMSAEDQTRYINQLGQIFSTLEVNNPPDTNLVRILFKNSNPDFARDVVNLASQVLVDFNTREQNIVMEKSIEYLKGQLENARREVEDKESQLYAYRRQHNIFQNESDKAIIAQQMGNMKNRLDELQDKITTYNSQIQQLDQLLKRRDYAKYTPVIPENDVLEKLREQLVMARIHCQNLLIVYNENHPEVIKARGEIEVLKRGFEEELLVTRTRLQYQLNVLKTRAESTRKTLAETEEAAGKSTEKDIEYVVLQSEANTARELYSALLQAVQEVSVNTNELLNNLIYPVEKASTPTVPIEPKKPLNLMLGFLLGLLAGVGFAYGREFLDQTIRSPEDINLLTRLPVLAVIPLYQYGDNGNKNQVLEERLFITDHPKSLFSEGITSLRNYLNIKLPQEGPASLLITSSVPREGKSLISSNLALSMAIDGKRTLLIDSDLHRPTIHKIFEFDKRAGLAELIIEILGPSLSEMDLSQLSLGDLQHVIQLRQWSGTVRIFWDQNPDPLNVSYLEGVPVGSDLNLWRRSFPEGGIHSPHKIYFELDESEVVAVDSQEMSGQRAIDFLNQFPRIWKSIYFREILEKYLRSSRSNNLFLLSAGQSPSNPSEVLGSDQMRILINIFEEVFDRVILDCPPSWPLSDVSVLAPRVDGVLWICRAGDTPKKMFKHGVDRLREVQPNILGVVLNAVDVYRDWYYYYGYSSYYRNYRYRYYRDYLEGGPNEDPKNAAT